MGNTFRTVVSVDSLKWKIPDDDMDLVYASNDNKRFTKFTTNFTIDLGWYQRNNKCSEKYYANMLCWEENADGSERVSFYTKGIDNAKHWLNYKEDKMEARPE